MMYNRVEYPILKVVSDGILSSTEIGEGRFMPYLVIDASDHAEISELIKLHKKTSPGDTIMQWTKANIIFKPKLLIFKIVFTKPMKITFGIEFILNDQFALVDGILQSKGLYLQTGKKGDKVSEFKNESIILEVPSMGFEKDWDVILLDILKAFYRKKSISKKESIIFARQHIKSMREFWNFRRE